MNWLRVGKIKGAHGLQGEMWALLFSKSSDWLKNMTEIGLGADLEQPSAFFKVKKANPHTEGLRFSIEGVDSRTKADAYMNFYFFIPETILVAKKGETLFLVEILGFEVFDQDRSIGRIVSFSSNGPQDLLCVQADGESKIVEIPFVEAFTEKVDHVTKVVRMNLPEGLLQVNDENADKSAQKKDDDLG